MQKKSQVSFFVVIGIFMFTAGLFFYYISSNQQTSEAEIAKTQEASLLALPVKAYVESCLQNTAKEGLLLIGLQGGYYTNPKTFQEYFLLSIPYYFYLGNKDFPPIEFIEKELSKYVEDNMPECINDFLSFREIGYGIEQSRISATSKIGTSNVNLNVKYPISIRKNEEAAEISEFQSGVDFNFKKVYSIVEEIVSEQENDVDYIPIGFLVDSAVLNNFTFELIYLDDNSLIYTFIFNESKLNNEPYLYAYAVEYNWPSSETGNKTLLYDMPNMTAIIGETFNYNVKGYITNLAYQDYTSLFEIDKSSGLIDFVPKEADKGLHRILIKATDNEGNEDFKLFELNIVAENEAPYLREIPDQTAETGKDFYYAAQAYDPNGDTIFYNAETTLQGFTIHPLTGEINFKPEQSQKGIHTITVVVVDLKGSTAKETFNLEVR